MVSASIILMLFEYCLVLIRVLHFINTGRDHGEELALKGGAQLRGELASARVVRAHEQRGLRQSLTLMNVPEQQTMSCS